MTMQLAQRAVGWSGGTGLPSPSGSKSGYTRESHFKKDRRLALAPEIQIELDLLLVFFKKPPDDSEVCPGLKSVELE